MKRLLNKEMVCINGGGWTGIIPWVYRFGKVKISYPGMKSQWVTKGTEYDNRIWRKK